MCVNKLYIAGAVIDRDPGAGPRPLPGLDFLSRQISKICRDFDRDYPGAGPRPLPGLENKLPGF